MEILNMKCTFGFYTDIHLSGLTPVHRVDDFPRSLLNKLQEIYAVAEARGCEFMTFGGDFFHTHRIFSYNVISDAMDIICGSKLKTYCCIGEHDLYGHNPESYSSSTLAFFVRHCPNMKIIHEPIDLGNVVLHAKHEYENMLDSMKRKVNQKKLNVLVCHELITNKTAMFDVINTETLKPCPYDIVVSGDLHGGFEPHEVDGKWFVNPGSIARRATNDAPRHPQFAIIEIEKNNIPIIDFRKIECAKDGNDVFGESIAEMVRNIEAVEKFDGNTFADAMLELEAESSDVHDLIQKAGTKVGLRKEVLDYLATKKVVQI